MGKNHRGLIIGLVLSTLFFILARAWMVLIYPHPEYRSDAVTYFAIVKDIMAGVWPSFYMRGPGFPLFELIVMMFSKSFYAIVLAQVVLFWVCSSLLIMAIALWKDVYAIPAALAVSAFYFVNATVIQDTMLYSDSYYTSMLMATMAAMIIFMRYPKVITATVTSLSVGYLLWVKFAAVFMVVLLLLIAIHGLFNKWPKKIIVGLFLPMGLMVIALVTYNGLRDGCFEITPFGGVNKMGPTLADWQTDPSFPEHINNSIIKAQQQFDKNDLNVIRTSWDAPAVWQAYQNNWGRCRFGSFAFDNLQDQKYFKILASNSLKANPTAYLKFVVTMARMHFFFYPTVDNQNFQINHLYREATALEALQKPDSFDRAYYKPLYQPYAMATFDQHPILGFFHPYDHYLQFYILLKPWLRHSFWPWCWIFTLAFCSWRCWATRGRDALVVLCTMLSLAPLGAGLLVAAVEVAILRYSYPLEFISYLCPLILWMAMPEKWKEARLMQSFFKLFSQAKTARWAWPVLAIVFYSAIVLAGKNSMEFYTQEKLSPLELSRRVTLQDPNAFVQITAKLRELGAFEHSLDAANTVVQVMGAHIHGLFEMALTQEAMGNKAAALATQDRILKAPPRSELDLFLQGQTLLRQQKTNEALQFYRQVRQKFPSFHPGNFQNLPPQVRAEWDRLLK